MNEFNLSRTNYLSINKKILYIFLIASFLPIFCLTYFSLTNFSNTLESEIHANLLNNAKSYGLFTFEKLNSLKEQLNQISQTINDTLPAIIYSEFEELELIKIDSLILAGFGESKNPILKSYRDNSGNLNFILDSLHKDKANNNYVLRASFPVDTLFSNDSKAPYNDPICVSTESGRILFCNEHIALKNATIKNVVTLLNTSQQIFDHIVDNNEYKLAAWELFLPSNFQSETWYFVIVKKQSVLLSAIKNFQNIIIPLALAFFLLIAYIVNIYLKKLMSPLTDLTYSTKKIAQGSYDVKLDINTNDELEELSNSFTNMASSLLHQHSKDEVFAKLEKSVLTNSNIHCAFKDNIANFANLLDVKWLIVAITDPININKMDSHCILSKHDDSEKCYSHIKHEKYQFEQTENDIYSFTADEFHENFPHVSQDFTSHIIWAKKLSLKGKCIGSIFVGTKDNMPLSSLNATILIEFCERFSTIYTTYKQRTELYYKAHYDTLTKLPNRNHLIETLKEKWQHVSNSNTKIYIYYIDLDNFKNVNDVSGHEAGNKVLLEVAKRISEAINKDALLARLSGDEFCILSVETQAKENPHVIANAIINSLKEPFIIKDMSFFLGASIGVAIGPQGCKSAETLIAHADIAMYKAKQQGKNNCVIFDNDIKHERNYRLSLERHLHYALENNEISIYFQPKIDLASGMMTSAECLARWHQRDIGFIPTDQFISLAEESGMIIEIGNWILRKSCYQFIDWVNKDIQLESIAVNVSTIQLASRNFSNIVKSAIKETGIPAHCLDLEITESAFINDESLLKDELKKLHALGVKISIDDFGKEYSSLSYLKKIPFDTLKIDREFIIDLETDQRDQHIIDVIINIGHTLNKKIVAEGIETLTQRNLLKKYGCDVGQGYLFSKPLSDIEFLAFAAEHKQQGIITQTLRALNN